MRDEDLMEIEIDLPLPRNEDDIIQAILNEEINPDMPTEDLENRTGYLFIYFFYNRPGMPEIEFEVPDTWEQWSTTFVNLSNPTMWETQLVGDLNDREGVEIRTRQILENLRTEGMIGEFRIRKNYVLGYL
jgi:hypothetical protein